MTTTLSVVASPTPLFSFGSHRLRIALLLMFGLAACLCMRANLGMAVVCMVKTTTSAEIRHSKVIHDEERKCRSDVGDISAGSLEWTPQMQASLLTANFYGSVITIAFSGSIADRFGPTLILSGVCFVFAIVTLATPFLAQFSYHLLFMARLIMGLAEGFLQPSVGSMAGRWFPSGERSTLSGIYMTGTQMGAAISSLVSSLLCTSNLGWPSIFYLFGSLGVIWSIGWLILASDSPANNRFIDEREAKYLETEIRRKEKPQSIPWRSILTSKPLFACICVQYAYNFSSALLQTFLPMYFRDELQIPLSMNGAYTMILFAVQIFMRPSCSVLADALKRKGILSATVCAKTFQSICACGIAISLMSLAFFASCDRTWIASVCLFVYGAAYSCGIPGYYTALLSIAPQFSGTVSSINMLSGTIANISSPVLMSLLISLGTKHLWKLLFATTAALNVIGGIIFLLCGEAEVQDWAVVENNQSSGTKSEENG